MRNGITIGSDPELFIWNKKENRVISSIGLIPGTKGDAYKPDGFPDGYGLQTDNVLAEFNIPPVKTKEEYIYSINKMKDYIHEFVRSIDDNLTIKCSSSELVDWDQLDSDEARLFGCSPDYNVYTEDVNPSPKGETTNLRSAGQHIHIGYPNDTISKSLLLIKYMDMYVGIPSMFIDKDVRRRELYGKAGCFRLCSWGGVEYRTLSGVFIENEEKMSFVWDQTMKAIDAWNNGDPLLNAQSVQRIINEVDLVEAEKACKMFNIINLT